VIGDGHIYGMPRGRLSAVHRKALRGGESFQVLRVVALKAGDKTNTHLGGQERIFAVSFLAPALARVANDIDVRRPEGEAVEPAAVAFRA